MKIYLIEIDNGGIYEDNYKWIEKVFKTYRGASEYLIKEGYEPFALHKINQPGYNLEFEKQIDEYECWFAEIIEEELIDR